MTDWLPVILPVWLLCGLVAGAIAQSKRAPNMLTWALLGFLLGPLGVLFALIGAKPERR